MHVPFYTLVIFTSYYQMIESVLQAERQKSNLSQSDLGSFLYGNKFYKEMKLYLEEGPVLDYSPNIHNKSRVQSIIDACKYLPMLYNYNTAHLKDFQDDKILSIYSMMVNPHQMHGGVHFGMFVKYIELMGTDQQKQLYYDKAFRCQITGCYAQTQVGHGSDIRGLETTATYDQTTKEWIIDSPTSSSAKYWPGDLGFFANHALVFAQTLIKGKNYGVNPFLVRIRDENHCLLPGIEGGDIGPKIGYHSKDNGYMYFRNIRIPKVNLLTKYVSVSDNGQYKQVGDPRVGYGTMMYIRESIAFVSPKVFAQALIIAGRYSLYRKQGLGADKKERAIIDYQTQQQKILPRIAQYYGMTIAAAKIRQCGAQNGQKVLKNDFSLLQQTHSNLAFSKCLFSQLSQDGMEILRRSMGGHGTSYYSGIPQIMNQFAASNTFQGENTVMYLQTARYALKSYLGYITKGKPLTDSVKYISRFKELNNFELSGKNTWTLDQLRDVLVKTLSSIIQEVGGRIASKLPEQTEKDIINKKVGIKLQYLAQIHGVYFATHEFIEAIKKEQNQELKDLMTHLCKLFIITQIQRLSQPIIEASFICPQKWSLLSRQKQIALKKVRPYTAALLDSFGLPDKYIRSQVIKGNPYENFLNRARECEINTSVTSSAKEIGRISQILASRPRL